MSVSASGVSAAPPAPAINVPVLLELLDGHAGVAERIQSYQDAKAAAEKALADLQLGNDVVARLEAAKATEQAAQDGLAAATKHAELFLAAAQTQASDIISAAQSESEQIKADLAAAKMAHTAWIENTKAEAVANYKAATMALSEAEKIKASQEAAAAAANKTQEAANKSLKDAQDLLQSAKKRSAKLQAALDAA